MPLSYSSMPLAIKYSICPLSERFSRAAISLTRSCNTGSSLTSVRTGVTFIAILLSAYLTVIHCCIAGILALYSHNNGKITALKGARMKKQLLDLQDRQTATEINLEKSKHMWSCLEREFQSLWGLTSAKGAEYPHLMLQMVTKRIEQTVYILADYLHESEKENREIGTALEEMRKEQK